MLPLLGGAGVPAAARFASRGCGRSLAAACLALGTAVAAPLCAAAYGLPRGGELFLLVGTAVRLRLDLLSAFVLLAVTVFGLLDRACTPLGYMAGRPRGREYYAYLLWTVGLSCGAVLANDLLLLLVFWGLLGFTLYLMIGMGGPDASAAAKKSFIIIGGSDCLLLLGVALVWRAGRHDADGRASGSTATGPLPLAAFLCFVAAAWPRPARCRCTAGCRTAARRRRCR